MPHITPEQAVTLHQKFRQAWRKDPDLRAAIEILQRCAEIPTKAGVVMWESYYHLWSHRYGMAVSFHRSGVPVMEQAYKGKTIHGIHLIRIDLDVNGSLQKALAEISQMVQDKNTWNSRRLATGRVYMPGGG